MWDREWSSPEPYRGANANMHAVEALLAAWDGSGEQVWLHRALRITERVVHGFAREGGWRLPEHFTTQWSPVRDYNREEPAHPFRPYGVTIGHLLEWARLCLHVRTALGANAPGWLLDEARELFELGVADGWQVDGAPGLVYTTDFDGRPVVRDRLHWVLAEAIAAAWSLWEATGERPFLDWYARWWQHAEEHFIDRELGSWRHSLDRQNRPAPGVWQGKPDVYHAYQAALLPELGQISSFAGTLRNRRRESGDTPS